MHIIVNLSNKQAKNRPKIGKILAYFWLFLGYFWPQGGIWGVNFYKKTSLFLRKSALKSPRKDQGAGFKKTKKIEKNRFFLGQSCGSWCQKTRFQAKNDHFSTSGPIPRENMKNLGVWGEFYPFFIMILAAYRSLSLCERFKFQCS